MVCPRILGRGATAYYAAFDVSEKETAIHVLDEHGRLGPVTVIVKR
jgi:hypothetical protein